MGATTDDHNREAKTMPYKQRLNQILNDVQRQRKPVYWATPNDTTILINTLPQALQDEL